ncbi:amidohydrolase family protein [Vibrio splendidus]|uniref:metal-dependent hydrolase family protein n=1 Tax=Vibrio TaxID=662 RepID=UPI0009778439|nr:MULTISPECIES: amidohydrolase family protein [Vibrio]MBO7913423.1 amidohydrolase family protein [Vibrio sp. G41H]MCF7490549.1 amidohydrolase family protein [Vibrio sp. G-C-1]MDH5911522.1 amidohydrolase family protein [Vibrio splendidus]MDH5942693.1 amidohydrolase family protein [Vibrio splendidus]MDH5985760.1 amidohydrolase family protein [Vibrio splendidus]
MKNAGLKLSVVALSCSFALSANAASTLFTNVDVFNGTENKLYEDHHVLVEDNLIKQISASPIEAGEAVVIDGEGKTLMPGLIDGHAHVMINYNFGDIETNKDLTDISIHATQVAKRYLDDGFTTVRDMGGPAFGLTREIEAGNVVGPRIYPSGAFISQTSGHGDFRDRSDPGFTPNSVGDISNFERMGIGAVADGVPEVLKATRLNLRNGATQIKIMAGGGGSSRFDPIDTTQYSVDETCAIVEAAKDWNTYVAAHTFNDRSVNRLLDCGVKSFEHGFFINDETMKRIAKEGGYVVPQMWGLSPDLAKNPLMPAEKLPMVAQLQEEYGDYGKRLLENNVKVVFASDYVGADSDAERARRYEIYWRTQAFGSNFEVLKQMTSTAGEMLAMSGPRGTTQGKLGVIENGAVADILLIDGNPLEDMAVIGATPEWFDADPEYKTIDTIKLVMKDGVVYRNEM